MSYTLTVEPDVVRSAEACASRRGTTLDAILRAYLVTFVQSEQAVNSRRDSRVVDVPDSVKAISGIISLPDGADEAKIVRDAIMSN